MDINVTFRVDQTLMQFLGNYLGNIEAKLDALKTQGEQTMAQIDDLNTAIQQEDVEITDIMASIVSVAADVTKLKAAVAAGATPTDLTNQLTAVQAHLASLTTGTQQLKDADTAANK